MKSDDMYAHTAHIKLIFRCPMSSNYDAKIELIIFV